MKYTVVFAGDSITDAFHLWSERSELGEGYVYRLSERIEASYPGGRYLNKGYDGFTVQSLLRRIRMDVTGKDPDLVVVLVGINDAALAMDNGISLESEGFARRYEEYLEILQRESHAKVLCLTPFIFPCPQMFAAWIPMVREMEAVIEALAKKRGFGVFKLQDVLNEKAEEEGYGRMTIDGMHLTDQGNEYLAEEVFAFLVKQGMLGGKTESYL